VTGSSNKPHVKVIYTPSKSTTSGTVLSNSFYPPNSGTLEIMPEFFEKHLNLFPERVLIHEMMHIVGFHHEPEEINSMDEAAMRGIIGYNVPHGIMSKQINEIKPGDIENLKLLYGEFNNAFDLSNNIIRVEPVYNSLTKETEISIEASTTDAEERLRNVLPEYKKVTINLLQKVKKYK